jgi:hypothetical protein
MNPELYDLLTKLSAIQKSRQYNWKNGDPASLDLEAAHQLELTGLRKRLEAFSPTGRVAGTEETPTDGASSINRCGSAPSVGSTLCMA